MYPGSCILDPISYIKPAQPSSGHSCLSDQQRHAIFFFKPCTMPPRGRPKRRAAEPDSPPTPAARRRMMASPSPHDEQDGAASRWDTGRPANWPVAKLLRCIADCGIKLPPGLKKAQVLRIYMDNCASTGDTVDQHATEVSADTTAPSMSTSPTTRWGIAAELNSLASRARQRQRDLPTPAVTTSAAGNPTPADSWRLGVSPDDETLIQNRDSHVTAQPLADVVHNLQRAMENMTEQLGHVIQHRRIADRTSTTVDTSDTPQTTGLPTTTILPPTPQTTIPPHPMTTTFTAPARPNVNNLTTAMQEIERASGVSLRAATADAYRWRCGSTTGVASENLPEVETVSATLRNAILDGKDVNLASLLIPNFDLGEYSRYAGGDGSQHLLRPLSSDPRLNRNLTLAEFISAFNKYRNVMCEVWDRRKELDGYEAIVVSIGTKIQGTAYYEYHKAFAARSAALILQHNVKIDWGVRDNGLYCTLFVGQTAKVCSLCGSVAHLSGFCPMLATTNATPVVQNGSLLPIMGRYSHPPATDIQGRPRVSVGQRELCNNFNSEQGCTRQNCKFLHSCLICRDSHSSIRCPRKSIARSGRISQPRIANRQPTAQ